jgi:hypothetical protein
MRCNVAVIAKHVSVSADGSLSLIDTYNARHEIKFPSEVRGINLALGFFFETADYGHLVNLSIRIVEPDGGELVTLSAKPIRFEPPYPRRPSAFYQALSVNVVFPKEGTYMFDVRVDGMQLAEVPLYVGRLPPV